MNVYQKLNEARDKFHQSKLSKSGENKFAGYSYFELGDFVVPALKIFKEVGLTSVISFGKEEAEMRIINTDKPEDVIVIKTPMSEAALKGCHPVQNLGAVETYLRRYLWVAAMEIVEHDALDATTGGKEEKKEDKKEIVAGRYEQPDAKGALFVESMKQWADVCTSRSELMDLWKNNQAAIEDLKKNKELFKKLQAHFATLKEKFSEA